MKKIEQQETATEATAETSADQSAEQPSAVKKRAYLLPAFIFILLMALIAGGAYQGWLLFMQNRQQTQSLINELQDQIAQRPTRAQLDSAISSIRQSVTKTDTRLSDLEQGQHNLTGSTQKLYDLYGRDENGWKLAEVEYLMSVAQHKLVLENDFEGAAKTLDAASERIAELADPGLLPVRVKISEEIAQLKTRIRPDLAGMTLLVSRLTRQIISLKPGYQTITDNEPVAGPETTVKVDSNRSMDQKLIDFMNSLFTIKSSQPRTQSVEQTIIPDVTEKLEDNLKLTRWAVLERDAFQYDRLMTENITLFKQYYDLENAANADFYQSLLKLQKSRIKPDLPDISMSLRMLKEIQQKQHRAPQLEALPQAEAEHG